VQNIDTLLNFLKGENPRYSNFIIPAELVEKRQLLRSMMNVRPAQKFSTPFLKLQDEELQKQLLEKGIIEFDQIQASTDYDRLKLWQGDITRLKVDAIVNAANSQMLGCFLPLHNCIDNAIHSAAGIQLRQECNELMIKQGHPEPTGSAKMTSGYNLPAKYVIHTVGPIIGSGGMTQKEAHELSECYHSCLSLAGEYNLKSIAFCCISTGEYRFPNQLAAEIAVRTVMEYFEQSVESTIESVVFNVFKDIDYSIYSKILKCGQK
jgi:O-acetyl-ADP-ribose deacetylase (regulator of RNase III)